MTSSTVAFQTLGCKLNFSETSTLARKFVAAGYERVPFEMKADVYVINTCSVTDNADKKFKSLARQTRQRNPNAYLIAVGCYAQLQPEELAKEDSVDLVLLLNIISLHIVGSEDAILVKSLNPLALNFITSDLMSSSNSLAVPTML